MRAWVRNSYPYRLYSFAREFARWSGRAFEVPSPHFIKHACLVRNGFPDAVWVETGTHLGQTTHILSKHARMVYSIEPEPTLFANAKSYFRSRKNVEILNGISEDIFPILLPKLNGVVNFWLDGHYSAGQTYKGPQDTPILDELRNIKANIHRFDKICVLVDDVRCFSQIHDEYPTYPRLKSLVEWAESSELDWHIEQDIFVARSR